MKPKLFTLLFALIVGITSIFANGVKIGDLYYLLDKDKLTAKVTYRAKDYSHNDGWNITTAEIPESVTYKGQSYRVTCIGEHAFYVCRKLTDVTIPNSVISIENYAFAICERLSSITIPNGVTSIGRSAFDGCDAITSVIIPNSVRRIDKAFYDCRNLRSVTIGTNVTYIDLLAFDGRTKVTDVTWNAINGPVYNFGSQVERFTFGEGVKTIPHAICKEMSKLTSITIPNSVTSIGNYAFQDCKNLTSIILPNSVTSIGSYAFCGCTKLKSITIPNSVTKIENHAFQNCANLQSITLPSSLTDIGQYAFDKCSGLTSLIIPNSVEFIGDYAFFGCPNLTVYTSSSYLYNRSSTYAVKQRYLLSPDQLMYYYPYSTFAKEYVEQNINEWQKKGEFERVADWQKRVNEQTRQQKIKSLLAESQNKYIDFHTQNTQLNLSLGKYDAENEVFAISNDKYGTLYMVVPFDEAQYFKKNWDAKTAKPQVSIYDDVIKLSALAITMPNGKQYTYRNTDAVSYNMAEMAYNFEPIELNLPKTSTAPKQGPINITKTTVKIGKSAVDTDIPETNASNPNTFVIIFANEDYKNVASVPFAKNDGTIFQKYCQKTLGIPTNNIHYVENATFNDMRIQLAWLKDVCDAFEGNAAVIVYYAGHGIPDEASKSAYLLPIDGDGRYVQSAYKLDDMYQKLGAMRARSVTVFMDACFSGSKREEGMLASARGVAIKVKSGQPQGKMVVFSAASGDETAYPNTDEQHGMFTYYLLKKLQDTKGDVTLQELGTYITTNVRQQSIVKNGKSQTPTVTPSSDAADWQNWKLK